MNYTLITPQEQPVPSVVPGQHWWGGRALCLSAPSPLLGLRVPIASCTFGNGAAPPLLSLDLCPVTAGWRVMVWTEPPAELPSRCLQSKANSSFQGEFSVTGSQE